MSTTTRLLVDALLVAGFGVQHSGLATLRVKAKVKRRTGIEPLAWRSVESLCNVVYILVAASLWQPTGDVVWRLSGVTAGIVWAVGVASWLWYWELHLYEYDCGLAFGSTTLVSRLAGANGPRLISWKVGSRRWIRFPVHTAFFGMFFAIPTMTSDLLVLAVVLNIYNVIGSILYDKRLVRLAGAAYRPYEAVTGLIWPPVYRAPRGAADLEMAAPQHWRKPAMHLPGVAMGGVLGGIYIAIVGRATATPGSMGKVAIAGLVGAIVSGLVIGTVSRPRHEDWGQQQTDLSTTVALSAALGVVTWASYEWASTGHVPAFAAFLPLWFTVQYLGHVFAFLADRKKWGAAVTRTVPVQAEVPQVAPAEPVARADEDRVPVVGGGRVGS